MIRFIRYIITLCLITFSMMAMAQINSRISSEGRKERAQEQQIFRRINDANNIAESKPDSAIDLIENALELSFDISHKRGEAYCYNTLGAVYYKLDQFDLAINNYEKAIRIFEEINDDTGLYHTLKYIGMAYDAHEMTDKAMEYYFIFLNKAEAAEKIDDVILALNGLARLYFNQGNYDQALARYEQVLALEEARENEDGIILANENIGKVHDQKDNVKQALDHYNLSGALSQEQNDTIGITRNYQNISNVYGKRKNYKKQMEYQQKVLQLNKGKKDKREENKAAYNLGWLHLQQNNSAEAIPYLKNSIDLANDLGELEVQTKAYEALSEAYEKKGDYDKALENYKKFALLNDSLQKDNQRQTLAALELSQLMHEQDKRIDLLEKDRDLNEKKIKLLEQAQKIKAIELKKQQLINYSLIGGLLVILLSSLLIIRSYRQKRKANLRLTLKSLRTQMNPHFIFNSLNSVNSFISKNDDRSANKYLADFSKLMRSVMENSNYEFVPLDSEIHILELYLGLEHFRFKDKFDYAFEVDPEIDTEKIEIPPMLVQPYIENAIWHGLRYKEDKGMLKVSIKKDSTYLLVSVEDDGIGRERSKALKTKNQQESKSMGLKNTEERLKILNDLHHTKLSVRIEDLNGRPDSGTRVMIHIPFHQLEEV